MMRSLLFGILIWSLTAAVISSPSGSAENGNTGTAVENQKKKVAPPSKDNSYRQSKQEKTKPPKEGKNDPGFKPFVPSEKIPADQAVDFPADI